MEQGLRTWAKQIAERIKHHVALDGPDNPQTWYRAEETIYIALEATLKTATPAWNGRVLPSLSR